MCGICGKINRDINKPIDKRLLYAMCRVIQHRGPDDDGFFFYKNVGLGMRRLSIIDLKTGEQPIYNEDRTVAIVFNGEIYNFQELRNKLISKGHRFKTKTDTETIVHLYEEKGEECIQDLRGMFGFAIFDMNKQRLMVARDRFGIKPIYFSLDDETLLFGSELKSLLQYKRLRREFDFFSLNCYFSFMNTIAPDTIFKNVKKLLPGHYFIYEQGNITIKQYWHFHIPPEEKTKSEAEYQHRLFELLKESVKIRLMSDVPLGVFLSGGIDSSTVVALMSQVTTEPIKTFSIGFEKKEFNELSYAKNVAKLFRTDHHEYVVKPDATEIIDDLVWFLDEPFSDPSAIPTYFVSKIARENVTVVLTGDGGDEMFGGYQHYQAEMLLNSLRKIPPFIRNTVTKNLLKRIPNTPFAKFNYQKDRILKNIDRIDISPEERFFSRHQIYSPEEKKQLYSDDFINELNSHFEIGDRLLGYLCFPEEQNSINKTLYLDTHLYLPNDMLMKVDRMSMANSLEARLPLLDHKLAEFVATIPSTMKVMGSCTKYILKQTMSELLPKEILYRQKRGFNVPLNIWFRNELENMASTILLDRKSVNRGFFNKNYIEQVIKTHRQKKRDFSFQIWSLDCI